MKPWINWNDGMKLGSKHLVDFQQSISGRINCTNSLLVNNNQYGYVPCGEIQNIDFLKETNGIIVVTKYSGLTPDGHWIYFENNELDYLVIEKPADGWIELKYVESEYKDHGELIEGSPDQKICLREKLEVTIVQAPSLNNAVVIGRIVDGKLDSNYIPPILFLSAISSKNYQEKIDNEINKMTGFCFDGLSTYTAGDPRNNLIAKLATALNSISFSDSLTPFHTYKKALFFYNAITIYKQSSERKYNIKIKPLPPFSLLDINNILRRIKEMYFNVNNMLENLVEIKSSLEKSSVSVK